jgi:hypothetical protein
MRVVAPTRQKARANLGQRREGKATIPSFHSATMPLQIMLFCSGNGNAPYREMADMTQWWNRRDALVRCVATSLGCIAADTKVWLYFPDDQTVLRMDMLQKNQQQQPQRFVSSERHVIGLWKRAAERPGTTVFDNDTDATISCQMDRYGCDDGSATKKKKDDSSMTNGANSSTKRDTLERIQQQADLEFLRHHRLNSSTDSILRRVSREKLMKIERELLGQQQGGQQQVVVQQQEQQKGRRRQRPEQQPDEPPKKKQKRKMRRMMMMMMIHWSRSYAPFSASVLTNHQMHRHLMRRPKRERRRRWCMP